MIYCSPEIKCHCPSNVPNHQKRGKKITACLCVAYLIPKIHSHILWVCKIQKISLNHSLNYDVGIIIACSIRSLNNGILVSKAVAFLCLG